jgi:hypothetical protein
MYEVVSRLNGEHLVRDGTDRPWHADDDALPRQQGRAIVSGCPAKVCRLQFQDEEVLARRSKPFL